jgi:hypothetical protein
MSTIEEIFKFIGDNIVACFFVAASIGWFLNFMRKNYEEEDDDFDEDKTEYCDCVIRCPICQKPKKHLD